jgi:hypothetical protein
VDSASSHEGMLKVLKRIVVWVGLAAVLLVVVVFINDIQKEAAYLYATIGGVKSVQEAEVGNLLETHFENEEGSLHEQRNPDESGSKYWWVDSGGLFVVRDGMGMTVQGELDRFSKWRIAYNASNPQDTDGGYRPQNIFRLISRSEWSDVSEEVGFRITTDNLSVSPNRNESNGVLLMSRYLDNDNLYYAGIRVDGAAVIKRKRDGVYETLAYEKILNGTYGRESNPSLLPKNEWMSMRMTTENLPNGGVHIELFLKRNSETEWRKILQADDLHEQAIETKGRIGIRSDFMDVQFDDFRAEAME